MRLYEILQPGLRAAIRHNGEIYSGGKTHLDVLSGMPISIRRDAMGDGNNRGYVTPTGRFLDRERAANYARKNNLFRDDAPDWVVNAREFASEYLNHYGR